MSRFRLDPEGRLKMLIPASLDHTLYSVSLVVEYSFVHLLKSLTYLEFTSDSLSLSLSHPALYYTETLLTLAIIPILFQGEHRNKAQI